jgi:hypothetical protein
MALLQSEILELFEKAKTKQEKIEVLKKHETSVLRAIMRINFDPLVKIDLPEGEPPYRKDDRPAGYEMTNLISEYRRFYIWVDPKTNLPKIRKEKLFIEMLEGLHPSEAEIMCLAKDRKLQKRYKSLKEDIVREAYPFTLPPKEMIEKQPETN